MRQKANFLPAIIIMAGIIVLVVIGSLYAFNNEPDTIQGQADVTEYRVSSKVPGRILKYMVKEGGYVHAGDTLAILEAPEVTAKLTQAQAAEDAAAAQNRKAERVQDRSKLPVPTKCGKRQRRGLTLLRNRTPASSASTTRG